MVSLRGIWIGTAAYLTFGVTIAPLPLLGCAGGLTKLVMYMNAGALFAVHSLLLLGYAGLYQLKVVKSESLKTPARISAFACMAVAIPTVLSMATCSPDWLEGEATRTGLAASLHNLANPKGWTVSQWTSLGMPCAELDNFENITSTYRTNLPIRGPSSLEAPFMNTITSLVMGGLGDFNQTELNTYYYPVPEENKKNAVKPGLFIFVHGGGWWSGAVKAPPGGCHATFAHSNGWAYAAVEYRLGRTGWSGDVQLLDVKDAIKHVLKHYGKEVDQSKVIVVGSSAGANLALAASYQLNNEKARLKNPLIAGVVAIAPSTSVEIGMGKDSIPKWSGAWSEAGGTQRYCEGVENCNEKLSPLEHVTQYTPPTIVLHGKQDEYYTPKHSRALMTKLAQFSIPHVYLEPPLMPHCLELAENILPYQMVRSATLELMDSL